MKLFHFIIFCIIIIILTIVNYTYTNDVHDNFYRESLLPDTLKTNTPDSTNFAEKLIPGKILYEGKCQKCHTLYEPADFKLKEWKVNLKEMRVKAGLSRNEYNLILSYLSANCRKSE